LKFRGNDTLVVDASDHAIASGQTSAKVLSAAYKRGAKLFSMEGLHAKTLVCGRVAVVGSANLSASSADNLIEAAAIMDDATIVAQAAAFIDQLTGLAVPVDYQFLRRILAIKVKRQGWFPRRQISAVEARGGRSWLVGIQELAEGAHPDEADRAEAGSKKARPRRSSSRNDVSWIRYIGKDSFRRLASEGDTVVQIWRPIRGKRATVFRPCPILHRQDEGNCVRL
jgi:hypothetical protein